MQAYLLGKYREVGLIELRYDAGIVNAPPLQRITETFGNQFFACKTTVVVEIPKFGILFAVRPIEIFKLGIIAVQRELVVDDLQCPVRIVSEIPQGIIEVDKYMAERDHGLSLRYITDGLRDISIRSRTLRGW